MGQAEQDCVKPGWTDTLLPHGPGRLSPGQGGPADVWFLEAHLGPSVQAAPSA